VAEYNWAFGLGVVLNVGYVVVEAGFGFLAGSLALLADASHNAGDVLGLLLAWGTVSRFADPGPVAGATVIWVAVVGMVINLATALLFMAGRERDLNVRGAFIHMAADATVSAGVVVAGLSIRATGWLWLDPVVSLVIAGVIFWGTWGLLRDAFHLAMGGVPRDIDVAGNQMTDDGVLVIDAQRFRSQHRNRRDARRRLAALIRQAAKRPKQRRKTKPSRASRERRLEEKRHRSEKKLLRKPPRKW